MATTAAKAFEQFLGRLEPTDNERTIINGRSASVAGYLRKTFGTNSDMPLDFTKLIGSAAKGTALRPVADVDILAVFGNAQAVFDKYRSDSKRFLYRVRDALTGYRVEVVGARGQAVRLFYESGPYADIAPVVPLQGGGYYLPSGTGAWIQTDPDVDATWFNQRNAALNYHAKPMVKLAKAWNRAHSSHFKSFHVEVMVASAFSSLGGNYRDALKLWFETPHISVNGPASGKPLDDYMPYFSNARQAATTALNAAKDRVVNALASEASGDHAEAIRLWRIVLGDTFPTYG